MTSITGDLAWLYAVRMVPLMLFVSALDTRKPGLTGMEVMAGAGKRLQIFMGFLPVLFGGGQYKLLNSFN